MSLFRRRIVWSAEERAAVLEGARAIIASRPHLSIRSIFHEAQAALPEPRRRKVSQLQQPSFRWFLDALADIYEERRMAPSPVAGPPPAAPIPTASDLAGSMAVALTAALAAERERIYELLRAISAQLVAQGDELARVRRTIANIANPDRICPSVASMTPSHNPAINVSDNAKDGETLGRPRKLRMAIVGLTSEQFEEVARKARGAVQLVLIERGQMRGAWPQSDAIILGRHVRHAWWDRAVSHVGRDRVIRVPTTGTAAIVAAVGDLCDRLAGAQD